MASATARLKWKRLLNELRFKHNELELVQSIGNEYSSDFQHTYETFCKENGIDFHELNKAFEEPGEGSEEEIVEDDTEDGSMVAHDGNDDLEEEELEDDYQMTKDELETHDEFSKLFKRLALIYHPDRLDSSLTDEERCDKLETFKKITNAMDNRRYFILLDLAEYHKIKFSKNFKRQIRWMKRELAELDNMIRQEKSTYNYLFSECETDTQRENLVKSFVSQLYGHQAIQND